MINFKQYSNLPLVKFAFAHKFTVLGFITSVTAVIVLSSTFLADAIYFDDPRHKDAQLEAWMTTRYVGMSYDLPRPKMLEIFGIEEGKKHPRRLDRIAERMGVSLDELTNIVRIAAVAYRKEQTDD